MEWSERVAVVTGSARGIGRQIALRLLQTGATVVVGDRIQEDVDRAVGELAEEAGAGERVLGYACDVSHPDSVLAFFARVKERPGRLDVLVNNAGVTRDNLFARMSHEQWRQVIDVNLTGTFLCSRAALGLLRKSPSGRIVNLSSVASGGNIGQANYAASKAGVNGLTKTLAIELGRYGITVNAVAPGFIDTDMTRAVPERFRQHWIDKVPLARAGSPDDVAQAVLFLASDDASYITGEVMDVDGGMNTPAPIAASITP